MSVCLSKIQQEFVSRTFVINFSILFSQKSTRSDGINIHIDFIQFSEKKIIFNLN